jgi:hypothetical protein
MAGLATFPGAKVAASPAGAAAAAAAGWLSLVPHLRLAKLAWGGLLMLWVVMFFSFELSHLFMWGLRRHAYKEA